MFILLLLMLPFGVAANDLDQSGWDQLLKRYVSADSRVDYQAWKSSPGELDQYTGMLAKPWPEPLAAVNRKAALINAYNALTIRWILTHYPVESIWKTSKPFTAARHTLNGKPVSLDAIETELRQMKDPRIHAVLVCAARSCPPLRREAYVAERLDAQLDDNTRMWLALPHLNEFRAGQRVAEVSSIFNWYRQDFESIEAFLAAHAPKEHSALFAGNDVAIKFKDYHWGLNDTSTLGSNYSGGIRFWWDWIRNR